MVHRCRCDDHYCQKHLHEHDCSFDHSALHKEKLRKNLELSSMDLINGLQSLQQRYLITKIKEDKILFSLNRVFREYVSNFC